MGVRLLRCPAPCFGGGLGGEPHAELCPLGKGEGEKRRTSCCGNRGLEVICKQKLELRARLGPAEEAGGVENTLFGKVFLIVSNNSS